jgi:cytidylate kinase
MTSPGLLEHADGFLNALWHGASHTELPRSPAPFVTLSREAGSGGALLARALARKLNSQAPIGVTWRIYEDNLTSIMLRRSGLSPFIARFLAEDKTPEGLAMIGEMIGLHPNIWDLIQKLNTTLRDLATQGHCILVGRGANLATAGLTGGIHVRTIAPINHRVRFVAQAYQVPDAVAAQHVARCDRARRNYVAHNFNADITDSTQYDLVVNTAKVNPTQGAALIAGEINRAHPQWLEVPTASLNWN